MYVHVEVLRPNGALLESRDLLAASYTSVAHVLADIRLAVRCERGWTPRFRVTRVDRSTTPWAMTDITPFVAA